MPSYRSSDSHGGDDAEGFQTPVPQLLHADSTSEGLSTPLQSLLNVLSH